jgi:hypothetical protein
MRRTAPRVPRGTIGPPTPIAAGVVGRHALPADVRTMPASNARLTSPGRRRRVRVHCVRATVVLEELPVGTALALMGAADQVDVVSYQHLLMLASLLSAAARVCGPLSVGAKNLVDVTDGHRESLSGIQTGGASSSPLEASRMTRRCGRERLQRRLGGGLHREVWRQGHERAPGPRREVDTRGPTWSSGPPRDRGRCRPSRHLCSRRCPSVSARCCPACGARVCGGTSPPALPRMR